MEDLYMEREGGIAKGKIRFYEHVSSICYEEYMKKWYKRTVQFSEQNKECVFATWWYKNFCKIKGWDHCLWLPFEIKYNFED